MFLVSTIIAKNLIKYISSVNISKNYIYINLRSEQNIIEVLNFIKKNWSSKASTLLDITAVDQISNKKRFEITYILISIMFNLRICVRTCIKEISFIKSSTEVFKSANWLEREIWDMFGIPFLNHPDLRRILTDYGFRGHPLKKDFPLSGYVEIKYDEERKVVISSPIEIAQEFRSFEFQNPWEKN